jgi:octaprenyl-diphosphate synthase
VDAAQKRNLIRTVEKYNKDKKKVSELIQTVYASGGIAYAQKSMEKILEEAREQLSELPPSIAAESMRDLITYVIEREN